MPYFIGQNNGWLLFFASLFKSFLDVVQAPRKFCDSRDSGWKMAVWDEGTIPKHPLLYSQEVNPYFEYHSLASLTLFLRSNFTLRLMYAREDVLIYYS